MTDSLSRSLARFAAGLTYDATPPEVIDKMKASLVHGLVMAFVGATNHDVKGRRPSGRTGGSGVSPNPPFPKGAQQPTGCEAVIHRNATNTTSPT